MIHCIPIAEALREAHQIASDADWKGTLHTHWHTWLAIREAMKRGQLWWPAF